MTNFEESMMEEKTVQIIVATVKELKRKYGGKSLFNLDLQDEIMNKKVHDKSDCVNT